MYGLLFLLLLIVNFFVSQAMEDYTVKGEGGNEKLWKEADDLSNIINITYGSDEKKSDQNIEVSNNNNCQNQEESKREVDINIKCKYTEEKDNFIYCPDLNDYLKFIKRASSAKNKQLYVHFYNHKKETIYFKYGKKDTLSTLQWIPLSSKAYGQLEYDKNSYLCFAEKNDVALCGDNINERAKDCHIRQGKEIIADNRPFVIASKDIIPGDYRILVLNSIQFELQSQTRTTINSYFVQSNKTDKNIWIEPRTTETGKELPVGLVLKPGSTVYIPDIFDNKNNQLKYGVYNDQLEDNNVKIVKGIQLDTLKGSNTIFSASQKHNEGKYTLEAGENNKITNSSGYKSPLQVLTSCITPAATNFLNVAVAFRINASNAVGRVAHNVKQQYNQFYPSSSVNQEEVREEFFCPALKKNFNIYVSQSPKKIIFYNSLKEKSVFLQFVKEQSSANTTAEFSASYEVSAGESVEIEPINGADLYIACDQNTLAKEFDNIARKAVYRYKSEFDNNANCHRSKVYAPICIESSIFKDTKESLFVIGDNGNPNQNCGYFTFKLYKGISNNKDYDIVIQTHRKLSKLTYPYDNNTIVKVPKNQSRLVRTPLSIDPYYENLEFCLKDGLENEFAFKNDLLSYDQSINLKKSKSEKKSPSLKKEIILSSHTNTSPTIPVNENKEKDNNQEYNSSQQVPTQSIYQETFSNGRVTINNDVKITTGNNGKTSSLDSKKDEPKLQTSENQKDPVQTSKDQNTQQKDDKSTHKEEKSWNLKIPIIGAAIGVGAVIVTAAILNPEKARNVLKSLTDYFVKHKVAA